MKRLREPIGIESRPDLRGLFVRAMQLSLGRKERRGRCAELSDRSVDTPG